MIIAESCRDEKLFPVRTKKSRTESISSLDSTIGTDNLSTVRNLELEGVKEIFQDYDLLETAEAVACVICGKNYKSKVCVKKHLWEHSVYWDLFDGLKKQQRVLSIQAAIILAIKFNPSLSRLLVTQPSNSSKRKAEKTVHSETPTEKDKTPNLTRHNNNSSSDDSRNNNDDDNTMYSSETNSKKRKQTDLTTTKPYEEKNSIDFLTKLSVRNEFLGRTF